MISLVIIGACYIDTILTVDHYPDEDEKLRASSITRRRGGNGANSLEVLQQLLVIDAAAAVTSSLLSSLSLVSVLPSRSSMGSQQVRLSFSPQVDLRHCIYREAFHESASSYIFKSRTTGSRTIVNYNELPEMSIEEFVEIANDLGARAGWFHFEGRIPEVTLECMRHLRRHCPSVQISVEIEKPGRLGLQELATEADVIFYSKSWAQAKGYRSGEECLRVQSGITPKASFSYCTWGAEGAAGLDLTTNTSLVSPGYTVPHLEVVDTIGAGDTFIAGMLYGLICHRDDWDLARKMSFANRLAGLKVVREGFEGLGLAMQGYL